MKSMVTDYLAEVLEDIRPQDRGETADYIPELASADPDQLGISLATIDGKIYGCGDTTKEFTIQSISKPFVYALALEDRGFDEVLRRVSVEPSGEAFNELSLDKEGRPLNPMINAGALTTHSLIGGDDWTQGQRLQRIIDGLSAFAGRRLQIDERICGSELEHAHRNLSIAHMLRSYDVFPQSPPSIVEGYTRACSLLVTTRDLAIMAATLANKGVNPVTGEQVVSGRVVRQVLSVMTTCGMYDAAGDWVTQVGIPAKSGVAGGLIGALPGQIGVATFSPRLDDHGNSVRGVKLYERLSRDMGIHLMEVPPSVQTVIRNTTVLVQDITDEERREGVAPQEIKVYSIQGSLRFAGAEKIVREFSSTKIKQPAVAMDLTDVHALDGVARRMILEVARRLSLEGKRVYIIDPTEVLPAPDPGDGGQITVVQDRAELRAHQPQKKAKKAAKKKAGN
ncbi:MAG TPA: glutaminase [Candidatus Corynebacterium gallistercoris]|uniref:Glutaminase n=1 Tax=Candidatus Corynebacterium gallistercoris TaxID=2838530 RepID=A0A9D1RWU8_9CORY|nr:glutaminase [Candidatus Corynebacterium gallistercoris]